MLRLFIIAFSKIKQHQKLKLHRITSTSGAELTLNYFLLFCDCVTADISTIYISSPLLKVLFRRSFTSILYHY